MFPVYLGVLRTIYTVYMLPALFWRTYWHVSRKFSSIYSHIIYDMLYNIENNYAHHARPHLICCVCVSIYAYACDARAPAWFTCAFFCHTRTYGKGVVCAQRTCDQSFVAVTRTSWLCRLHFALLYKFLYYKLWELDNNNKLYGTYTFILKLAVHGFWFLFWCS